MENNLIKKLFYKQARIYGTDLHVLEFSPFDFEMVVAEGDPNKKEPLSEIKQSWYEKKGYSRVAAINMQFFWTVSLGLQYLDKGFLNNPGNINDQFLELIYENKDLKIDNIVGTDIKKKYPSAEWAAGVGFQLILNGEINTRYGDKFDHFKYKHPRTAIGQKGNSNIILLATDGRTGTDSGLTGTQLADVMLDLGCITAISFDGGGSTTMCVGNKDKVGEYKVVNQLAGNYQRPIGSALILYAKNWTVEDRVFYYKNHIPQNTKKRRLGKKIDVKYITVHSTANKKSTARDERNWLVNPNNPRDYAGFHIVVDDKEAVETIPLNEMAVHAEDDLQGIGNNYSIGIEICESGNRDKTLNNGAFIVAELLKKYNLTINNVKRHQDWKPSKNCPRILDGEDWTNFLELVAQKLGTNPEEKDYKKEYMELKQENQKLKDCIENIRNLVKELNQDN